MILISQAMWRCHQRGAERATEGQRREKLHLVGIKGQGVLREIAFELISKKMDRNALIIFPKPLKFPSLILDLFSKNTEEISHL